MYIYTCICITFLCSDSLLYTLHGVYTRDCSCPVLSYSVRHITVADLENEKGWFQFIVVLARGKFLWVTPTSGHVRTLICHMIVQVNFH